VFRTSFLANDGYTPVKGTDYFDGVNGISAYTSALNGGFVGTEAQWIASERFARGSRSQRFNGPEVHSLPC
jgi:hypothetical protein